MKLYTSKTPTFIRYLYPERLWRVETAKKELYLTFDDGPIPKITPWVLGQLEQYNAKATFFCIGENARKYAEILQHVIDRGHRIGNHTQHHLNGWKTRHKTYLQDVKDAEAYLPLGEEKLFRPPYGKMTSAQANKVKDQDYKIVMYDVVSGDFDASISQLKCYSNVIRKAQNGSIIVFHDSLKAEKHLRYTLPKILRYYNDLGFRFKSL
ncbi:polysaccharide deacetylase family protein [Gangjinia marincola]|uniref:Polysaccharide deacetylase family protein n=1 Tax=Gangjinia marincola TaxID=578463 RepID=A0ABN1MEF4_9FLAO